MASSAEARAAYTSKRFSFSPENRLRNIRPKVIVTLLGFVLMIVFLMPLGYMITTAFKQDSQSTAQHAPLWPAKAVTYTYQGPDLTQYNVVSGQALPLYNVPTSDGMKQYALVKGYREDSEFIDPAHPEKGVFDWIGRYRTLDPVYQFALTLENVQAASDLVNFPLLFRNTLVIAILSTIGTLLSCILVAYGFARFPIPGKNLLFILLISTIILPPQATIIPLFILFSKIGWTGTWLPLIVPAFFANAYDVFLLRQYFMSMPKELDEAAMIDGAGPLRTLISVIIPQAIPAITAVTLFHFFYSWNDYFTPLVYLVGKDNLLPLSVGIGNFFGTFSRYPGQAMATAVIAILLPALIFFLAQRQFTQGIVITGVEK
ncbi:MAG: carbohydrate ABC transporter permease [Aggregatilineales bacterium]